MAGMQTEGRIDQVKGRIKEAWGALTDDDIDRAGGKLDRLAGIIKEKTGESADAIQEKLLSMIDSAREKVAKRDD